jgi:hypothetical protein
MVAVLLERPILRRLKAAIDFEEFRARLKPCPFKTLKLSRWLAV